MKKYTLVVFVMVSLWMTVAFTGCTTLTYYEKCKEVENGFVCED